MGNHMGNHKVVAWAFEGKAFEGKASALALLDHMELGKLVHKVPVGRDFHRPVAGRDFHRAADGRDCRRPVGGRDCRRQLSGGVYEQLHWAECLLVFVPGINNYNAIRII